MKTKSKFIALIITAIFILICALFGSCTNQKNNIFVVNYTIYVKNYDTNKMELLDSKQIFIKANSRHEMQTIFDNTIPMKYDCDSISMKSTTCVILK